MKIKRKTLPKISFNRRLYIKRAAVNHKRILQERLEEMEQDFTEAMTEINSIYRGDKE